MAKKKEQELRVVCTLTDRATGITKNVEDLTEEERRRAVVIMGMRALKSYYGSKATITLTNPRAEELYGIKSI